jgi:glyoxylase-like metal-dependent hydrolase (beta-lactamase superfamily II)
MLQSPCLAYVVRHPSQGTLLIDTGFHPDATTNLRGDLGFPMSILLRGLEPNGRFDEQLNGAGVQPGEVERVVMTHLHVDHSSGMRLLPRASFICTREEWAAAHASTAPVRGYARKHLPPESRMQLLDYGREGVPAGVFERTIDLFGDGSIRLLSTPGHTPGHQSVLLELEDGRTALIAGDAAYTLRNIREQLLPLFTADDRASRQSLRTLGAFVQARPDAILVPTHDPDAWRQLEPRA